MVRKKEKKKKKKKSSDTTHYTPNTLTCFEENLKTTLKRGTSFRYIVPHGLMKCESNKFN